ncbi:Ger(x)C family spore germination C-terminal domain-containing protein [Peribacillus sp. NPDC096447]|uniref:Ger(x)C family spore germination C-terminal domain-containing protein n=1 Tax=Peribacillus sp. NPDC096447 TaxID=3364394 RepID=UPI0038088CF2
MESVTIISNNKIKEFLPKNVMNGGRLVNKDFVRDSVTLFPGTKKDASVVLYDKKTEITPITERNGKVRFDVNLKIKASVEMMKNDITREQYEAEIKRSIKKEIKKTYQYTQKRDIDLFKFSKLLYRKDIETWKRIEREGMIPLEDDTLRSIWVEVELQDTGKQKLSPIFEEQGDKGLENQ